MDVGSEQKREREREAGKNKAKKMNTREIHFPSGDFAASAFSSFKRRAIAICPDSCYRGHIIRYITFEGKIVGSIGKKIETKKEGNKRTAN